MTSNILHITNGDSVAQTMKKTALEGDIVVYCDVLHEGPTPQGLEPDQWRAIRAQYFADKGWSTYTDFMEYHTQLDNVLSNFSNYDEIVLWFEHDLFDQLLLIRLLYIFSKKDLGRTKLSLLCIGEFPGIVRFIGLGQLTPEQISSLFGTQHQVTTLEFQLASQYWIAFCSKDPSVLIRVINNFNLKSEISNLQSSSTLPFLRNAFIRHLQQYPSMKNGLSRTEQHILEVIDSGIHKRKEIFQKVQDKEENPFMGDTIFYSYLDTLLNSKVPLLRAGMSSFLTTLKENQSEDDKFLNQPIHLTPQGKEVLQGNIDWTKLNPINRWLGGVHLVGNNPPWRWETDQQQMVQLQ